MRPRPSRFLTPAVAGWLATFALGCGGIDESSRPRPDGAVPGDATSPQPDTWPPPLDSSAASADGGMGPETATPPPVTVVILPDTQYYSRDYPEVFTQQTAWIVAQRSSLNIAAVLHVGDVVDNDTPKEWTNANTSMRRLDGVVPYVLVPGNHDTDSNRQTLMDDYFGPASMPWITGTMTTGQIENNYALLDLGPRQWLIVGLEFGPRDAVVAWADAVLKAYPTLPAIVVTHAYLYGDGNRYDINLSKVTPQAFIPQDYEFTPSQGINDGEMLWQKLVLPNRNVRMVLCGHDTGWARLSSTRPDGSVVHQMLSDYQWWGDEGEEFGYGWLRVMQIDYDKQTIAVQTYSPYLGQYLTDDANQFTLDLNL
jgi:hypothetical protein